MTAASIQAPMQEKDIAIGVSRYGYSTPTPETATTTHYFYQHARSYEVGEPDWDDIFRTQFTEVFLEDKAVLEVQ